MAKEIKNLTGYAPAAVLRVNSEGTDMECVAPDELPIATATTSAITALQSAISEIIESIGDGTVGWGDISDKPATFPPSAHSHILPIEIVFAASDEITAITTGTAKVTFRVPRAFKLTEARATLTAASSSGNPAVDIKKNGASIFSTILTIDATEKTSKTAATAYVLAATPTNFADDDEVTVDVTAAGTGAKGLKIYLIGERL